MDNRPQYFIDDFINSFLPNLGNFFLKRRLRKASASFLILTLALVIPLAVVLILYLAYEKNIREIKEAKHEINERHLGSQSYSDQVSHLKDILNQARGWEKKLFFFSLNDERLNNTLNKALFEYHEARIIPILTIFLEEKLTKTYYTPDIEALIETFNIYLMVQNKKQFNKQKVSNWFLERDAEISSFSGIPVDLIRDTARELNSDMFKNIKFNEELYTKLIVKFNNSDFPGLIFKYIENKTRRKVQFRIADYMPKEFMEMFEEGLSEAHIPYLYTREGYNEYLKQQESVFNKIITIDHLNKSLDLGNLRELVQQTNYIYINHYVSHWNEFLSKIRLKESHSLNKSLHFLRNLSLDMFSAFKFLQIINKKFYITEQQSPLSKAEDLTKASPAQLSFQEYQLIRREINNAAKYKPLDAQTLGKLENKFLQSVQELTKHLVHIVNTPDQEFAAFHIIKDFEALKDSPLRQAIETVSILPEPLSTIYKELIDDIGIILYEKAANYVNRVWEQEVYSFFTERLEDRYPINKDNYSAQISLTDFAKLYGDKGIIDSFVRKYICLKGLSVTDKGSDFLRVADSIKKGWFNEEGRLAIQFNIMPINMDSSLSKFNLLLAKQKVEFTQDKFDSHSFSWPNKRPEFVKTEFIAANKYKSGKYYEGPWSWYRAFGLDRLKQDTSIETLQNVSFESPLGSFAFSITFAKEFPLLTKRVNTPEEIVRTKKLGIFYGGI